MKSLEGEPAKGSIRKIHTQKEEVWLGSILCGVD
jgi:hypothetical protein